MIFVDLNMEKQTDKKYHGAMESQHETVKGITVKMSEKFSLKYEAK